MHHGALGAAQILQGFAVEVECRPAGEWPMALRGALRQLPTGASLREQVVIDRMVLYVALKLLQKCLPEDREQIVTAYKDAARSAYCAGHLPHLNRNDLRCRAAVLIRQWLDDHLLRPSPLSLMSKQLDLTPCQLARLFKREYGISPQQYLTDRRMAIAESLLKAGCKLEAVPMLSGLSRATLHRQMRKRTRRRASQFCQSHL
jgi:AraC-like DNA-binding protein